MSKSIGNVLLVRDLLQQADGEAIRYVLLSAHYRAPLEWNDQVLAQAQNNLERLYGALRHLSDVTLPVDADRLVPEKFLGALQDDLNTPQALAELFVLARRAYVATSEVERAEIKAALLHSGEFLGLLQQDPEAWFAGDSSATEAAEIEDLIVQREAAREARDWALADEIRNQLTARRVVLEDSASGTIWRIEKGLTQ